MFDDARLIGITAVFTFNGDSTGQTAILAMSFIDPEYRGRGLSRLLYEARVAWAKAQPNLTRVIVSHRESNEVSRRANQHFGFVYTHTTSRTWPDGVTENELHYELRLDKSSA